MKKNKKNKKNKCKVRQWTNSGGKWESEGESYIQSKSDH